MVDAQHVLGPRRGGADDSRHVARVVTARSAGARARTRTRRDDAHRDEHRSVRAVMEDDHELNDALVDAARYGETDEVRDALTRGARADAGDGLLYAAANGHEEIVQVLLEFGADVNKANAQGSTALHWACLNGHVSIVQLLIDKGGNASACNQAGRTPLDEAMHNNREECVKVIMESDGGEQDEDFEFEEADDDEAENVDSEGEEE